MDRTVECPPHPIGTAPDITLPTMTVQRWMRRAIGTLARWRQNARTRRQLARLDARELADCGIYPAERAAELDKPFWR